MNDMLDTQRTVVRATPESPHKFVGVAGMDTAQPVIVTTMPIWKMVGVRVLRVYLQSFLGLLLADGTGMVELAPAGEAWQHMQAIALLATAPSFVSLCQNALEFLTNLDVNRPSLRA